MCTVRRVKRDGIRQRTPILRAFQVLGWMATADGDASTLSGIAAGVNMSPSTVHRVLAQLANDGLVRQEENGRYGLGLEFMRLAWTAAGRGSLREAAAPILRELGHTTGETAWLGLYESMRREMMFVSAVESPQAIRHVRPLNQWLPIHGGATGRAILAFLPEAERREIVWQNPLPALTDQTITDPGKLDRLLEEVRRRRYAISRGERASGGVGIAAPVLAEGGRVLGVIGVGLPEQRFHVADEADLSRLVLTAAAKVAYLAGARK